MTGKYVLITGSNRGLGKAIMQELASSGMNIWAHARKETPEFLQLMNEIKDTYHVDVNPVYFDMKDEDGMKAAVKLIHSSKKPVDVLVNNAGIASVSMFGQTPISKIKEVFEVNLFGQMALTQLVLRLMTRQHSGSIINIASVTALIMSEGQISYATSKSALITWSRNLAAEYGRYGIRVNSLSLGLMNTDMKAGLNEDEVKYFKDRTVLQRIGEPEDAAKAVKFLASDDSSFITGQNIRVDGGLL
jgi:3-oxoacyl-[acyl-carrier protein] reductase